MTPSAYNAAIAAALQASAGISSHCITKWGKGCQVQEGENPGAPLELADAPFLCCLVWPSAELGPIADADAIEIVITAGVGPLASVALEAAALPTVTSARTAAANGLRSYGSAKEAEALLLLAITAAKAIELDGAIIGASRVDSDGWTQFPLQIASAVLAIREANTL